MTQFKQRFRLDVGRAGGRARRLRHRVQDDAQQQDHHQRDGGPQILRKGSDRVRDEHHHHGHHGDAPRIAGAVTTVACLVLLIVAFPTTSPAGLCLPILFNVGGLAVGELTGGPEPDHAIVLALSCASRHPAIALTIASTNYAGHNFAAAVIIILL